MPTLNCNIKQSTSVFAKLNAHQIYRIYGDNSLMINTERLSVIIIMGHMYVYAHKLSKLSSPISLVYLTFQITFSPLSSGPTL